MTESQELPNVLIQGRYEKLRRLMVEEPVVLDAILKTDASDLELGVAIARIVAKLKDEDQLMARAIQLEIGETKSEALLLRDTTVCISILMELAKVFSERFLRKRICPLIDTLSSDRRDFEIDPQKINSSPTETESERRSSSTPQTEPTDEKVPSSSSSSSTPSPIPVPGPLLQLPKPLPDPDIDQEKSAEEEALKQKVGIALHNQENLVSAAKRLLDGIFKTHKAVPPFIRNCFRKLFSFTKDKFNEDVAYRALGGFFFLRFVCPAIVGKGHVTGVIRRKLILVAKLVQYVANEVDSSEKEDFMNSPTISSFIHEYIPLTRKFFDNVLKNEHSFLKQNKVFNGMKDQSDVMYMHKVVSWLRDNKDKFTEHLEECLSSNAATANSSKLDTISLEITDITAENETTEGTKDFKLAWQKIKARIKRDKMISGLATQEAGEDDLVETDVYSNNSSIDSSSCRGSESLSVILSAANGEKKSSGHKKHRKTSKSEVLGHDEPETDNETNASSDQDLYDGDDDSSATEHDDLDSNFTDDSVPSPRKSGSSQNGDASGSSKKKKKKSKKTNKDSDADLDSDCASNSSSKSGSKKGSSSSSSRPKHGSRSASLPSGLTPVKPNKVRKHSQRPSLKEDPFASLLSTSSPSPHSSPSPSLPASLVSSLNSSSPATLTPASLFKRFDPATLPLKSYHEISEEQLSKVLEVEGLKEEADKFLHHKIAGDLIDELSEKDLKKIGVDSLGNRRRILRILQGLIAFYSHDTSCRSSSSSSSSSPSSSSSSGHVKRNRKSSGKDLSSSSSPMGEKKSKSKKKHSKSKGDQEGDGEATDSQIGIETIEGHESDDKSEGSVHSSVSSFHPESDRTFDGEEDVDDEDESLLSHDDHPLSHRDLEHSPSSSDLNSLLSPQSSSSPGSSGPPPIDLTLPPSFVLKCLLGEAGSPSSSSKLVRCSDVDSFEVIVGKIHKQFKLPKKTTVSLAYNDLTLKRTFPLESEADLHAYIIAQRAAALSAPSVDGSTPSKAKASLFHVLVSASS
eukprot:TRINITY_DN3092_c0_g1_i1.p1 TRINITY_DN3092_c0_g1~~TRINITY_DN3092_c0_g1_i1.p1  ORF type:complete len:1026 (-),score=549.26 TRINITY_DN3092_c0_g1_i1:104-3181(-)